MSSPTLDKIHKHSYQCHTPVLEPPGLWEAQTASEIQHCARSSQCLSMDDFEDEGIDIRSLLVRSAPLPCQAWASIKLEDDIAPGRRFQIDILLGGSNSSIACFNFNKLSRASSNSRTFRPASQAQSLPGNAIGENR